MSEIEKLTDEERYQLRESQYEESRKALRIIDAHAADRAALVAQLEAAKGQFEQGYAAGWLQGQRDAPTHAADRAALVASYERSLQAEYAKHEALDAEVAALVAKLEAAKRAADTWRSSYEEKRNELQAAEALASRKADVQHRKDVEYDARQAALVAQLEEAELGMREANLTCEYAIRARDAAEAQVAELTRERDEARTALADIEASHCAADDRWQAAERTVTQLNEMNDRSFAEVARLTEALAAAERKLAAPCPYGPRAEAAEARVRELERDRSALVESNRGLGGMVSAAESECAALRAEVERLRAALLAKPQRGKSVLPDVVALQSSLAAANALLKECGKALGLQASTHCMAKKVRAHLAAQPATAPARTDAEQAAEGDEDA